MLFSARVILFFSENASSPSTVRERTTIVLDNEINTLTKTDIIGGYYTTVIYNSLLFPLKNYFILYKLDRVFLNYNFSASFKKCYPIKIDRYTEKKTTSSIDSGDKSIGGFIIQEKCPLFFFI